MSAAGEFRMKKLEGGKYRYEISPGKWVSRQWVHLLRKLGKLPRKLSTRQRER